MTAETRILGEHPFAADAHGKLKSRIGTVFPQSRTLITLPGIHATQRQAWLDFLKEERRAHGLAPLTREEERLEWTQAVDLIFEADTILIRPDPENMPLAFCADDFLQEIVSKQRIKFLGVLNKKVREAIKMRGEWWRIAPLPKSPAEMEAMIRTSRAGMGGKEIYYYSRTTGIRYLTCQQFAELEQLDDSGLREHLAEIQEYSRRLNAHGHPEVALFAPGGQISPADFAPHDFFRMDSCRLRDTFHAIGEKFCRSVAVELRRDDPANVVWRNSLVAALIGQEEEVVSEETLLGLSPEFFMQIEWLPGGRIEEGELIFDSILGEADDAPDKNRKRLHDEKPQKFIFNFVREYGDLEYVNIGRVVGSLSHRPTLVGRRGVYVAAMKLCDSSQEIVSIIRMQKRGVREHLEEGLPLLDAMLQSAEYTEIVLDRRLACRQLGMNVPPRIVAKTIHECWTDPNGEDFTIWSPYFERDYIRGVATDKLPSCYFEKEGFALPCARLLGRAAAQNIIVGRCDLHGRAIFDDGDEVLVLDADGLPADLVVADHTGAFNDYLGDLERHAAEYAGPVNRRAVYLSKPNEFAEQYLSAFVERFLGIQEEYRRRRKAFDTLFKYHARNGSDCFASRWEKVLQRLDRAEPQALAELIRRNLTILTS
jgi:hypothetical protein